MKRKCIVSAVVCGELLESSGKKIKIKKEIKRAGELLESSSGSKGKIKEEKMKE